MLPITRNIQIYQGDTFSLIFRLRQRNQAGQVSPVNLSGATAHAQIRNRDEAQSLMAEFTTTITNPENGEVRILLTADQTRALTQNGKWDVQINFANGTVRTYMKGSVSVTKEVTRV